jgi:hypothetical protein
MNRVEVSAHRMFTVDLVAPGVFFKQCHTQGNSRCNQATTLTTVCVPLLLLGIMLTGVCVCPHSNRAAAQAVQRAGQHDTAAGGS